MAAPLSEFAATPARVVVHDPSPTGALDALAAVPADELKERTLFAAHPDAAAFAEQHAALVRAIEEAGVEVVRLDELVAGSDVWRHVAANPNQVYTRDSVITLPWLPGAYVAGAMRVPIRRSEVEVMSAALRNLGLRELFAMPPGRYLEGGDVIPLVRAGRRTLLVGYGPRSARESIDLLWERLAPDALDEVVGIELEPWRMNLDGVLVPVASDTFLVHPGSIRGSFVRDARGEREVDVLDLLRESAMEPIEVTRKESMEMQACNCFCLGDRRIVCYDLCSRTVEALRERGITLTAVPGSELIKGTGGPRCMTRPIYG
ncbi:MAG TPA: arginine deiminase family protein [Gaiellaceae bacterium]|nr:arginine deiminase family protein [Gaiellaceae bacterium]